MNYGNKSVARPGSHGIYLNGHEGMPFASEPAGQRHYPPAPQYTQQAHSLAPLHTQSVSGGSLDPNALIVEFLDKLNEKNAISPEVRKKIIKLVLKLIVLPEVNDLSGLNIPYKYIHDTYDAVEKNKSLIKQVAIALIIMGLKAYAAATIILHDAFPSGLDHAVESVLRDAGGSAQIHGTAPLTTMAPAGESYQHIKKKLHLHAGVGGSTGKCYPQTGHGKAPHKTMEERHYHSEYTSTSTYSISGTTEETDSEEGEESYEQPDDSADTNSGMSD